MTKSIKLRQRDLFSAHADDIARLFPRVEGVFMCPLCFRIFLAERLEELLDRGDLTIGHVWPNDIRKGNGAATKQQVLLCKDCNSGTGGHGDRSFNELHRMLEGEETGRLYRARDVSIITRSGQPIRLRTRVILGRSCEGVTGAEFIAKKDKNKPTEWKRWEDTADGRQVIPIIAIHPAVRPEESALADAGRLTSAYLLAFYQMGYRYILNQCLDPLRAYLANTAKGLAEDASILRDHGVSFFDTSTPQPQLQLAYRIDRNTSYLRVAFRGYGVVLPIPQHCHYVLQQFADSVRDRMGSDDNEIYRDLSRIAPHGACEQLADLLGPTDYQVTTKA